ncbi:Naphthalene 1,2-dioxygenase/salicylate 5-hydroxylase systems, ferredoxin component [Paraburkholderia domus]|jgi:Ferredoxin subunits of nitrite reductase and ring-hydroxylating dioxygenases|uniref:Rieske (2Fe-2S) protein n=1 Tax=Paraburkholderia domus TaxID=2793075 RepID=UPI001911E8B7|nr:Rieske 2Fe-2S domain-containing protein [Paraburkholderia domus]MBK5049020.1 Rieske 2Fe-2S domain-containing protein [Burkholderia sp. R-70006]CAE6733776.1 Naphthalene 1,2-dioxygenase/salicylate 5-hydroxylase systems, ferredoxin component [Paraburkholderia domus]
MSRQIPVGSADELAPGQRKLVFVDGRSVVLFNIDGGLYAVENTCPHNGASLAGGQLEGRLLRCPAHGLRFDVTTGCMPGKGGLNLATCPIRNVAGTLELTVDDTPASPCHAQLS